jgi:hypothetical protein
MPGTARIQPPAEDMEVLGLTRKYPTAGLTLTPRSIREQESIPTRLRFTSTAEKAGDHSEYAHTVHCHLNDGVSLRTTVR